MTVNNVQVITAQMGFGSNSDTIAASTVVISPNCNDCRRVGQRSSHSTASTPELADTPTKTARTVGLVGPSGLSSVSSGAAAMPTNTPAAPSRAGVCTRWTAR